jgi:hypothetical protein
MKAHKAIALLMMVMLVNLPLLGTGTPVGKVLPGTGMSTLNGTDLKLETTLFSGDTLATKSESMALVQLSRGDQVYVGPASQVTLLEGAGNVVISLANGMALVRSGRAQDVMVNAAGLVVRPQGPTSFEVYLVKDGLFVATREGQVEVLGTNRSFTLEAGKAMKFEVGTPTAQGPVGVGAHSLTPIAAVIVATAISLAVAIPVGIVIADNRADDAREAAIAASQAQLAALQQQLATQLAAITAQVRAACIAAIQAISPTASTAGCP